MKKCLGLTGMFLLPASLCFGSLEFKEVINVGGTGLGAVATVLTAKDQKGKPDPGTDTKGCISYSGSGDVIGDSYDPNTNQCTGNGLDVQQGQSQTVLFSDSKLNFTSVNDASDIGVFYNPSQSGGSGATITLTDLRLLVYSDSGELLFESGPVAGAPLLLNIDDTGTGNSGFLFVLDEAQTIMANNQIGTFDGSYRFGLSARMLEDTGGLETFSIVNLGEGGGGGSAVPEPATFALTGGAFVAFAMWRRRRQSLQ